MKNLFKVISTGIFLGVSFTAVLSQKHESKTDILATAKSVNIEDYKDWKKNDLNEFSFYLPKEFKLQKVRGIDLGFWGYKTNSIDFQIYSGLRLPEQSFSEKTFPTYVGKSLYINNLSSDIWSYEYKIDSYPYKYIQVARFYIDKAINRNGMVIYLGSKENEKELAEKIFLSVKLKDTLTTKKGK